MNITIIGTEYQMANIFRTTLVLIGGVRTVTGASGWLYSSVWRP
jgi:hypothetical protein